MEGDNILVRSPDGQALLTDFGSCTWRGARVLTPQSHPPGTPQYASPQAQLHQWKFRRFASARYEASPADDVYALGVTAYRLVAGRYPLVDEALVEDEGFTHFPELVPVEKLVRVSPELARWIGQLLSVQPEARGTPAELVLGLELAANTAGSDADQPITSLKASAPSVSEAPVQETREEPPAPAPQPVARRRWPAAVAGVGVVLAAGIWCMWQASRAPSAASSELAGTDSAEQHGGTTGLGEIALSEPLLAPEPLPTNEGIGPPRPATSGQKKPPHGLSDP